MDSLGHEKEEEQVVPTISSRHCQQRKRGLCKNKNKNWCCHLWRSTLSFPLSLPCSKRDHHRSGSSQSSAAAVQLAVENEKVESRLDERRRQRRQRRQYGGGGGGSQVSLRSDEGSSSLFQDPALALAIRELQVLDERLLHTVFFLILYS